MEYNSNREILVIPEYGRHIQNMLRYAREIPEREKRQQVVEQIVGLMMQMHPLNRNLEDFREKLWRHAFQIAEYKLDVATPLGYTPSPEDSQKKPERVSYSIKDPRFRHYGNNVQKLIAKAVAMEDGEKKNGFVQVIGSYMKLAYRTWSREHYVSDDIIIEDLKNLSDGKLQLVEDAPLDNLTRSQRKTVGNEPMMPPQHFAGGGRPLPPQQRPPMYRPGMGNGHGNGPRDRDRDRDRGGNMPRQQPMPSQQRRKRKK
ncbi:MAG: hypothetical protein RLY31_803 [Bacteroidota bacterium]|jgi:hypothetical protein